jgi:hypothetical protein
VLVFNNEAGTLCFLPSFLSPLNNHSALTTTLALERACLSNIDMFCLGLVRTLAYVADQLPSLLTAGDFGLTEFAPSPFGDHSLVCLHLLLFVSVHDHHLAFLPRVSLVVSSHLSLPIAVARAILRSSGRRLHPFV